MEEMPEQCGQRAKNKRAIVFIVPHIRFHLCVSRCISTNCELDARRTTVMEVLGWCDVGVAAFVTNGLKEELTGRMTISGSLSGRSVVGRVLGMDLSSWRWIE
ncbi:hypothetical protein U1Q18_052202 [Sarracenia purpurea var. burkii]